MNQYLVQVRATSSMKNDRTFTFHLILWQTRKQFPCVIMTKTFRVDRFQGTTGWPEVFVGCIWRKYPSCRYPKSIFLCDVNSPFL